MIYPLTLHEHGFERIIAKRWTRCSAAQRFLQLFNMLSVIKLTVKFIYKKYNLQFLFLVNQTTHSVYFKS